MSSRVLTTHLFLGLPISCLDFEESVAFLESRIATRTKTFCVTINLDLLRLADTMPAFYEAAQEAQFVVADGAPLVWLSKLGHQPIPERVAGSDMTVEFLKRSHTHGHRIYILGAAPGVADKAKTETLQKYPNAQIVGTYSPTHAELADEPQSLNIIDAINAAGPDILFVAFGSPKQELWVHRYFAYLNCPLVIPCGASIDFVAGVQQRAPRWLANLGCEWLYRLCKNPQRLFKRYVIQDIPFLCKLTVMLLFGLKGQDNEKGFDYGHSRAGWRLPGQAAAEKGL